MEIDNRLRIVYNNLSAEITYTRGSAELVIFLSTKDVGRKGLFYVKITTNETNSGVKKRSANSYSAGAATFAPRVWNETLKQWVPSADVKIDKASSGEKIVFKSNFMGSMTAGLTIPPNKIDFDTVFNDMGAKTAENPAVLIVVCLLAGLYILLLIPLRRFDLKDKKKWMYLPILSNQPDDKFIYQISFNVGKDSSKHFNSTLFMVLYGENGKIQPRALVDGKRKNFKKAKTTNLTVTCKEDLGRITHVHVWTLATEEKDSLYIDSIVINDPLQQIQYTVICSDWISPVKTLCYNHEIFKIDMEESQDFKACFKSNASAKIFDDHIWLSVIKRPNRSNFSRVQRWSMCMSTLFLTMVVNAMWFPANGADDQTPRINIGPISISWRTFYISIMGSVIVIPPCTLMIFFFRRSRPYVPPAQSRKVEQLKVETKPSTQEEGESHEGKPAEEEKTKKDLSEFVPLPFFKKDERLKRKNSNDMTAAEMAEELNKMERSKRIPISLPWWCIIFGYILCGLCVANGVWWPYLYSLQWGKEISEKWLTSLVLSLVQSIIVIQPVKVILITLAISFLLRKGAKDPDDVKAIRTVSELYGQMTPPVSYEPPIIPQKVTRDNPVIKYKQAKLGKKLFDKLKGIITQLLYLGLLIAIVTHNTSTDFFYQNDGIKNIFGFPDASMNKLEQIIPWLREEVFPKIYPSENYNGDTLDLYDQQFIYNVDGLLMGPVRMKQNRAVDVNCSDVMRVQAAKYFKIYECNSETEARNWNENWEGLHGNGTTSPPYMYKKVEGMDYEGLLDRYSSSGYIVTMQRYNWHLILDFVESGTWIDKLSRAVSVEFVINNMNVNIFTQVKIHIETPSYGGVFIKTRVSSFRPYPYRDVWDFVFLVIQCIWFLILCYIVFQEVRVLILKGARAYFTNPWNVLELLNVICAFLSIIFYAIRTVEVIEVVTYMKNNKEEYVDFNTVMIWDRLYSLFVAAVFFISMIQLYKPLDFSRQLTVIKASLRNIGTIIMWYTLTFCLLLVLYSHTMNYALGDHMEAFSTLFKSVFYLFGLLLGALNYYDIIEVDTPIIRLLFALFMLAGNLILLNLFVSVINEAMAYVKDNPDNAEFDEALNDYIGNRIKKWWTSFLGIKMDGFEKVRRGGPWNYELELYYNLVQEDKMDCLEETQACLHQTNVTTRSDEILDQFSVVFKSELSETEKAYVKVCTTHTREEHAVRSAIQKIIYDLTLSSEEMRVYMNKKNRRVPTPPPPKIQTPLPPLREPTRPPREPTPPPPREPTPPPPREPTPPPPREPTPPPPREPTPITEPNDDAEEVEGALLEERSARIGPEGGQIEILPGTSINFVKGTFKSPSLVKVEACVTKLFASHVFNIKSEQPFSKPIRCVLPFKDGKRREYCNVFVQRDGGPWVLTYNSVTCYSETLRCMCHPKGEETSICIAAKATPRSVVTFAGQTLDASLVAESVLQVMQPKEKAHDDTMVQESAINAWKEKAGFNIKRKDENSVESENGNTTSTHPYFGADLDLL